MKVQTNIFIYFFISKKDAKKNTTRFYKIYLKKTMIYVQNVQKNIKNIKIYSQYTF